MCLPWAHRYRTTASKPARVWEDGADPDRDLPIRNYTRVLQTCIQCGRARSRAVEGIWSDADLWGTS